jgi:2-polyprenyl-3-methyl-5-hydroxy-6-metoxy-1,4-benzoquinol methylase
VYYADPQEYWSRRHRRHGTGLEGVGTVTLGEELNTQEYERKWRHVGVVLEGLRTAGARSLLDAGCGNGYFTERALQLGFEIHAVDFSADAVRLARSQAGREGVQWSVGPLDTFAPGRQFDVVMTIDVLFHVVDDELWRSSVVNLASLVSDNGTLVVQEHLVEQSAEGRADGTTHTRWRDLTDYRRALDGWDLISHDHYDLPESASWKDLVAFRRSAASASPD